MIVVDSLDATGLRHGYFDRAGGVSEGLYASLNCGLGSNDDPERVRENRRRALALIGTPEATLLTVYQVHGAEIAMVEEPWTRERMPRADGMVTRRSGIALGILTADCAPVLLADAEARVIGAAHAGWRGALSGVVEATVEAMVGLGADPSRIRACIGPCIAQRSYEVGPTFPAPFLADEPDSARFFGPSNRGTHHRFDLSGYVRWRLARLKLGWIEHLPLDTCADENFFSYRRATLRNEGDYGRALSTIILED